MNITVKNTSLYLIHGMVSGAILFTIQPIIAYKISPDIFGQFVLIQIVLSIAINTVNLGLHMGYERYFFEYASSNIQSGRLFYTAFCFATLNVLWLFVVFWLGRNYLTDWFNWQVETLLITLVFLGTAVNSLAQYFLIFLKNMRLAKSFIIFALIQPITNLIVVAVLLFFSDHGVFSLAWGLCISNVLMFAGLLLNYHKKLPFSLDFSLLKDMLKVSLPITPKSIVGALQTQFDKLILGYFISTAAVGIYQIGQTIANTIFLLMTGFDRVLVPEVYRRLFSEEYKTNPYGISNLLKPFLFASVFYALLVCMFSKEIIMVFFPVKYKDSALIIIILTVFYASLFFVKSATSAQIYYKKKTVVLFYLSIVNVVISITFNLIFIHFWGIVGVAWATTLAGILSTILGFYFAQKAVNIYWPWNIVAGIYAIFLLGVFFSLCDYVYPLMLNGFIALSIKLGIIVLFIIYGFKTGIIDLQDLKHKLLQDK